MTKVTLMESIIAEIYKISPYLKYANKTDFTKIGDRADVYGEITQTGTNSLVNYFNEYFNKDTIFYDLGSGLGKMVLHIGMQYGVKKSIGIEYSKERHKGAIDLQEQYAKDYNNITFLNKSFFDHDISDATVIYIDNTVFTDEMNNQIYEMIPRGCLLLYKKLFIDNKNISIQEQRKNIHDSLVERTYKQSKLVYLIKK